MSLGLRVPLGTELVPHCLTIDARRLVKVVLAYLRQVDCLKHLSCPIFFIATLKRAGLAVICLLLQLTEVQLVLELANQLTLAESGHHWA